jgi:hypothetical protein
MVIIIVIAVMAAVIIIAVMMSVITIIVMVIGESRRGFWRAARGKSS